MALAEIIGFCFSGTGRLRGAAVVCLFKKSCKDKPVNYRTVSLTSLLGLLMERIMGDKIQPHFEGQELIRDSQHSFVHGK